MRDRLKTVSFLVLAASILVMPRPVHSAGEPDFEREIQPLLDRHCWECHGASKQKAGLRLDNRLGALTGGDGGPALNPEHGGESLMIRMILGSEGPDKRMPPKGPPLPEESVALLRRWIDSGAAYPADRLTARTESDHWAFLPLKRTDPPAIENVANVRNPIDNFILARLEQEGLTPSPAARKTTLIRRIYLDLIGLPPSPDEVEAFLKDDSPDAFKRVVDSLLDNPHYGERWGRHWLDQARFADSHGYTFDNPRTMWPYRDWVIRAINDDMPFDRFTIEQIAGDLLPDPTTDQLVATGFHRNTLIAQEGGTDHEQFRVESVIDRVNTTGAVWMGLTIGCAQCHTHKYDPITQREYYNLYAFFNTTEDVNNVGPTVRIRPEGHDAKAKEIAAQLAAAKSRLAEYDRAHGDGQKEWEASFLKREPSAA